MDTFDIAASAMTAQRLRLDTISSNLANINTTRKPDGTTGGYHRRNVVFAPLMAKTGQTPSGLSQELGFREHSEDSNSDGPAGQMRIGANGKPYFQLSASQSVSQLAGSGVQVVQINEDTQTPMRLVYDPSHPDANEKGYVEMPNVNPVTEMVDMIAASRAYEANVTAFQSAKAMAQSALDM